MGSSPTVGTSQNRRRDAKWADTRIAGPEPPALVHLFYQIPSETQPGVVYTIGYAPREQTVKCSCPAGMNNVPCKHVRLLQLRNGWDTQRVPEGRA